MKTEYKRHHHVLAAVLVALALLLFATRPAWGGDLSPTTVHIDADFNDPSESGYGYVVFASVQSDTGQPTGTIEISDGETQCDIELPANSCVLIAGTVGERTLSAHYLGDANFAPSTAESTVTHTVVFGGLPEILSRGQAVGNGWDQGNSHSYKPTVSGDGSLVAFHSIASNLATGDVNGLNDVFVYDRNSHATRLISANVDGNAGNGDSRNAMVSANGQWVVFQSFATDLVGNEADDAYVDVFAFNLIDGTLMQVSRSISGAAANGNSTGATVSADGSYVAFVSEASNLTEGDTNGVADVFVHDLMSGETRRLTDNLIAAQPNGASRDAAISGDGQSVAFVSDADNLVVGDSNGFADVFVADLNEQWIDRVNVLDDGTQANRPSMSPAISHDGQTVAFVTSATNLVPVIGDQFLALVVDRHQGQLMRIGIGHEVVVSPSLSADGQRVAVSTSSSLTTTGWSTIAEVHDLQQGMIHRVGRRVYGLAPPNQDDLRPTLSADGSTVVFEGPAGDSIQLGSASIRSLYAVDIESNVRQPVSISSHGNLGNRASTLTSQALSGDGRLAVFESRASNLVSGDVNGQSDVFIRDRYSDEVSMLSANPNGQSGNAASRNAVIASDGSVVAFESDASDLLPGSGLGQTAVYILDRANQSMMRVAHPDGAKLPSISADGSRVAYQVGNGASAAIEVYDRALDTVLEMGADVAGAYRPAISPDGTVIAASRNRLVSGVFLADLILIDVDSGQVVEQFPVRALSGFGEASDWQSLSQDGSKVAFTGQAGVVFDQPGFSAITSVFVLHVLSGEITMLTPESADGDSRQATISPDGKYVAFTSVASNLTPESQAAGSDVFVVDVDSGELQLVSYSDLAGAGNADSADPAISAGARFIAISSRANNLVINDLNAATDVMLASNPLLNDGPVATPDHYIGEEDQTVDVPVSIGLLVNDSDPDEDRLQVVTTSDAVAGIGGTVEVAADGSFWYSPPPDLFGLATFEYIVSDGQVDSTGEVVITVNPVNDPPSFMPGGSVVTSEDASAYFETWATDVRAGPSNETDQLLDFVVTPVSGDQLFTALPTIDETGRLAFSLASDRNGSAVFEVVLRDDAGGNDQSVSSQLHIDVGAVNDAPSFSALGDVELVRQGPVSLPWASDIRPGPDDEAGQSTQFSVQVLDRSPGLVFVKPPKIEADGQLKLHVWLNNVRVALATLQVVLKDNGGTANGGADQSMPLNFTVRVALEPN